MFFNKHFPEFKTEFGTTTICLLGPMKSIHEGKKQTAKFRAIVPLTEYHEVIKIIKPVQSHMPK
jgi:hypothetical protein